MNTIKLENAVRRIHQDIQDLDRASRIFRLGSETRETYHEVIDRLVRKAERLEGVLATGKRG